LAPLFYWKNNQIIDHEIVMITDDLMRVGSWNPELVQDGKLKVMGSPYTDEYSFYLYSVIIGGREAMFPYGG